MVTSLHLVHVRNKITTVFRRAVAFCRTAICNMGAIHNDAFATARHEFADFAHVTILSGCLGCDQVIARAHQ